MSDTPSSSAAGRGLVGILICIVLGALVGLAGSASGLRLDTGLGSIPLFILCGMVGFVLHWLIFVPSFLAQTEHYFDLTGALSFIGTILLANWLAGATTEDLRSLQIAIRDRLIPAGAAMSFDPSEARFTDALIRLRAARQLYQQIERGVTFLAPGLFQASINLPAIAPTGNYDVQVDLYSGTVLLARQQTNFEVVQIGFEQQVGWLARNWSLAYGVATAMIALLFGWLATVIFRRD